MTDASQDALRRYILAQIAAHVAEPPQSEFQRGFLECLYVTGREALGMEFGPEHIPPGSPQPPARPGSHLRLVP